MNIHASIGSSSFNQSLAKKPLVKPTAYKTNSNTATETPTTPIGERKISPIDMYHLNEFKERTWATRKQGKLDLFSDVWSKHFPDEDAPSDFYEITNLQWAKFNLLSTQSPFGIWFAHVSSTDFTNLEFQLLYLAPKLIEHERFHSPEAIQNRVLEQMEALGLGPEHFDELLKLAQKRSNIIDAKIQESLNTVLDAVARAEARTVEWHLGVSFSQDDTEVLVGQLRQVVELLLQEAKNILKNDPPGYRQKFDPHFLGFMQRLVEHRSEINIQISLPNGVSQDWRNLNASIRGQYLPPMALLKTHLLRAGFDSWRAWEERNR